MSFYSDASLVLIPSGYKDQKIYSAKPTDGSADLAFTRASDATRVASNGLIEKVRTNLALYSNDFSNAAWIGNTLVTANNQTSPDGTLDADTFTGDGTTSGITQSLTISSVPHTFSVYAKAGNYSIFRIFNVSSSTAAAWFNLSTGTTGNQIGGTSKIEAVGNGWYRCSFSINSPNTTGTHGFVLSAAMGSTGGVASGSTMYFWKAQIETGDIATEPITTLGSAVSVGPVSGLPRLDYLNSSCPRLLLEPQTTALNQFSEQLDNSYYAKTRSSVTANATSAPDGYNGADKLIMDSTSAATHILVSTAITVTGSVNHTLSVFVKAAELSWVRLMLTDAAVSNYFDAYFDLSSGTAGTSSDSGSATFGSLKIENYGGGWYRCSITGNLGAITSAVCRVYLAEADNDSVINGDSTSGVYLWGMNLTQTSYVQSYLPTLSTSVTRVADAASKTGISSLIGQSEGTLYWEGDRVDAANFGTCLVIDDNSTTNRIYILSSIDGFRIDVTSGGTSYAFYTSAFPEGKHKIAVSYSSSSVDVYIDGVSVYNDTSVTIPACSRLVLGNWSGNTQETRTNQALVFKTRLTNAQLAELTTL